MCCYIDAVGNSAGDPAWIPPAEEARGSCVVSGIPQRECGFKQGDDKRGDIFFVGSTYNHIRAINFEAYQRLRQIHSVIPRILLEKKTVVFVIQGFIREHYTSVRTLIGMAEQEMSS